MVRFIGLLIPALFILGCQADPAEKKVPKDEKKIVNKGLNNVSFNPAVDILFIVDDSGSMSTFQANMAANAELFVQEIFKSKFIDYHIGVTTSTYYETNSSKAPMGRLHKVEDETYVTRKTRNGPSIMAQMLKVGTSGSGTEHFFSIAELAFSPENMQGFNKGFFRPDAFLAIFLVTDTDDQSQFSVTQHTDFLMQLKNNRQDKIHYTAAIIDQITSFDCSRLGEEFPRKIKDAVSFFNGSTFELCNADYGVEMAKVAQRIVEGVSTIYLEELPDVKTIEVTFGGKALPNDPNSGWVYDIDLNAIRISPDTEISENEAAKLNIKYEAVYK